MLLLRTMLAVVSLFAMLSVASAYNEPDSFVGIKFGESVKKQISVCPTKPGFYEGSRDLDQEAMKKLKRPCYLEKNLGSSKFYELENLGTMGVYFLKAEAREVGSKMEHIDLTFGTQYLPDILPVFRERYGPPTERRTVEVQSGLGAKFPSIELRWIGKKVSIILRERDGKIDEGSIRYFTDAWVQEHARRNDADVKKKAAGL